MARKIRFPLIMSNCTDVRTLEELRENFDLKAVLGYFENGKLKTWLEDRYYDKEAEAISALDKNDADLSNKICSILGVAFTDDEVDMTEIERRNEKLKLIRQYSDDKEIINNIDSVAFNQDDLLDILDNGITKIYLCHGKFEIPARVSDITYIGIKEPEVSLMHDDRSEYDSKNIKFIDIPPLSDIADRFDNNNRDFATLKVKDVFTFGNYNGKPIEWFVLKKDMDSLYVISRNIIHEKSFGHRKKITQRTPFGMISSYKFVADSWESCEIRKWVNNDFYNTAFSTEERIYIKEVNSDKITLLSKEEAESLLSESERALGSWWWLRSHYSNGRAWRVCNDGSIGSSDMEISGGICPAFHLAFSSSDIKGEAEKEEANKEVNNNNFGRFNFDDLGDIFGSFFGVKR